MSTAPQPSATRFSVWIYGLAAAALLGVVLLREQARTPPAPDPTGVVFDVAAGASARVHRHVLLLREPGWIIMRIHNPEQQAGMLHIGPPDARNDPEAIDPAHRRSIVVPAQTHFAFARPAYAVGTRRIDVELEGDGPLGLRVEVRPGIRPDAPALTGSPRG